MNPIVKQLERCNDQYIQFSEEEMLQLDIKPGDKFSCNLSDEGIITLTKYVPVEIDFSEFTKEMLIDLISISIQQRCTIEEVLETSLTELVLKHEADG